MVLDFATIGHNLVITISTQHFNNKHIQVAAGSNQLFTGSIDGVDKIFSEKY